MAKKKARKKPKKKKEDVGWGMMADGKVVKNMRADGVVAQWRGGYGRALNRPPLNGDADWVKMTKKSWVAGVGDWLARAGALE